jgi:hypothetical protein
MKERVMVDSNGRKYITTEPELKNDFNPDWDTMAVMVEEQQRMAKRIEELEAALEQRESAPTKLLAVPALLEYAGYVKKKDWVGLTYEDKKEIRESTEPYERETIIRLTEAKLREKNNG